MGMTLMINTGVPKHPWVEAFTSGTYTISKLQKTASFFGFQNNLGEIGFMSNNKLVQN